MEFVTWVKKWTATVATIFRQEDEKKTEKSGEAAMKVKELLPLGSVVLLKGGKKRLMVTGIKQINSKDDREYDYTGVLYPEGHMGDVGLFLFDHKDIEETYARGYTDEEWEKFIGKLEEFYKK
jgi:hypothetical protein